MVGGKSEFDYITDTEKVNKSTEKRSETQCARSKNGSFSFVNLPGLCVEWFLQESPVSNLVKVVK
jgi:hypothetical protein